MTLRAEASTVHVPIVERSAAPAPTLTTMWLWAFCHRYSSTTPRYVMFLPMSNIAREWWASVGAAGRAIPTATTKASNGRRAREPAPTIRTEAYARGDVHSNTVEGFFSLLKRGINGTFHHVSRGHLNRYCDEFAFRYENRKASDNQRATMLVAGAEGKRLTYKQL